MDIAAQLASGTQTLQIGVSSEQQACLLKYLGEMQRWSARINLTAIRDPREGVEKHLLDSLTLVPYLEGNESLLDLGSGAGLPGIPLKVVLPGLQLVSVDAAEKKCLFQRQVLRKLGIEGQVVHARIEELMTHSDYRHRFDVVTARALSSIDDLLLRAEPFLAEGGRVLVMKGPEGQREWREAQAAGENWSCLECREVTLPFSAARRCILVFKPKGHH